MTFPPACWLPPVIALVAVIMAPEAGALQTAGVMVTEKALMLPTSPTKKSWASSCQLPVAGWPWKPASGELGVKLPVNGAWADETAWMLPPALWSSRTVWQKLLPPVSVRLISRTDVELGAIREI